MTKRLAKMSIRFTPEEDAFLRENIDRCRTIYDLAELFNAEFQRHKTTYANLQKRLSKLGLKKGTHNIRKEKVHHRNTVGTIIKSKGHGARVKTESGYVAATTYFRNKYGRSKDEMIIHLNGDLSDFSEGNIEFVTKSVYSSLCWRKWLFQNAELTKTAILAARLLEYFPELRHNENQYYGDRGVENRW